MRRTQRSIDSIKLQILIIPNSFKGSLPAKNVAQCLATGMLKVKPNLLIKKIPIAEGGTETLEIIKSRLKYKLVSIRATDPLGKKIKTEYGIIHKKKVAINNADLVITGEGKMDKTTFYGKATGKIIELCRMYKKPVMLVCGTYPYQLDYGKYGIKSIYCLTRGSRNKNWLGIARTI